MRVVQPMQGRMGGNKLEEEMIEIGLLGRPIRFNYTPAVNRAPCGQDCCETCHECKPARSAALSRPCLAGWMRTATVNTTE